MAKGYVALILGALLAGCGGGDEAAPPPAAPPPPPPVAATPPPAPTTAAAPVAKPSMAELQVASSKAMADALNAHDAKKFAALFADDGVWSMPGLSELKGRADIEKGVQGWFDGFKDEKFAFSRAWAKNDMVAYEFGWAGTHNGDFMGIKPSEKQAGTMGLALVWFNADGTIKRENQYTDSITVMTQVGAMKGKTRPVPTLAANMDSWTAKNTPDEDKNVDAWKTMFGALETKKEADFVGAATDDIEWSDMTQPEMHKGKADVKKAYGMLTKAFPDIKMTPATAFGVGDTAIVEYVLTGTQKGALGPIPAKNKPVTIHGLQIVQVKDGKIAKGWDFANNAELYSELGLLKAPGAAAAPAKGATTDKPMTDKKPAAAPTPAADAKKPAGAAAPAKK